MFLTINETRPTFVAPATKEYTIVPVLGSGSASLELKLHGSTNWGSLGDLTGEVKQITLSEGTKIKITASGGAFAEIG
ncbi:hypothetical protein A5gp_00003 [Alteromonas phage vB_AemP_PT15-A5]|nr:hypothetical protein A5gp_00003 [Alteromonas phage vB_AemP_PT15-A5]